MASFAVWAVAACLSVLSTVAFGGPLAASYIYGLDDNNVLWVMNLATQTSGSLFQTDLVGTSNGLAYNDAREELFAVDANNDLYWWKQGESNFLKIASGTSFGIGTAGTNLENQPWGAAYYDSAYWFFRGSGNPSDTLLGSNVLEKVSIDYSGPTPTVTGFVTYTVPEITGSNAFGDIAIAVEGPNQGKLFAYTFGSFTPNAIAGRFYSLDLNTIASGSSGFSLISTTSGTGLQIAFSPDDSVLYGHNHDDGTWYTVDTTTGALNQVGSFTTTPVGGKGFRDLGGSSVQAVPEPSTWMLAAMGGGIAAWTLRRRRGAATKRLAAAMLCLVAVACVMSGDVARAETAVHQLAAPASANGLDRRATTAHERLLGTVHVSLGQCIAVANVAGGIERRDVPPAAALVDPAAMLDDVNRLHAVPASWHAAARVVNASVGSRRTDPTPLTRKQDFLSGASGWRELTGEAAFGRISMVAGPFDRGGQDSRLSL